MQAQETQVALPFRSHTILGVCEAIGEDFGFNPTLLRVPLAATVLWSPMWAIAAYLALGAIVFVSRLASPSKSADQPSVPAQLAAPANQQNELRQAA